MDHKQRALLKTPLRGIFSVPKLFHLWWKDLNTVVTCTIGASLPPDPQPFRLLETPQTFLDDEHMQNWVIVQSRTGQDVFVEMLSDTGGCSTGHCGAGAVGCQSNAFVGLFARTPLLRLKDVPITVTVGSRLLLSLPKRAVFQLASLAYGLPLIALLLGLGLGQMLAGDWGALVLGLSALLLTWFVVGKLGLVVEPKILEIQE